MCVMIVTDIYMCVDYDFRVCNDKDWIVVLCVMTRLNQSGVCV